MIHKHIGLHLQLRFGNELVHILSLFGHGLRSRLPDLLDVLTWNRSWTERLSWDFASHIVAPRTFEFLGLVELVFRFITLKIAHMKTLLFLSLLLECHFHFARLCHFEGSVLVVEFLDLIQEIGRCFDGNDSLGQLSLHFHILSGEAHFFLFL